MLTYKQFCESHWFTPKREDEYVYHGTPAKNLEGIKKEGLKSFLYNWYATDPKVSMHYAYRKKVKTTDTPYGWKAAKQPGALLRVHKKHVNPEAYEQRNRKREDFWAGPDVSPDKIEIRHQGKWKPLK